jgi:hypothetical protein
MTGDTGAEPAEQTNPAASHDARAAALDRIAAKLERLSAQRMALRKAMRQFGEDFDAKAWSDAFVSLDADEINRVLAVIGGYLALVNNTMEAITAGARLVGIKPADGARGAAPRAALSC